ncbi:hypothetical protein QBC40DRAFT_249828 [Triangularia verruculosa]|uniref:Uncharacterized protein n=1 Tax=Triangularia verruculosa TaxID=2587418 RepID=A0AAN6XW34_9PEZI|nr:hypothetical protein QBC40DRAFT_249828 [Triangularia verruculosa]
MSNSRSTLFRATFDSDWKPVEFLRTQFDGRLPSVGSMVSVTGSALYAYATSCEEYMATTWPDSGMEFLSKLHQFLDEEVKGSDMVPPSQPDDTSPVESEDHNSPSVSFSLSLNGSLTATINGTMATVIDVAQQLAWLSAALGTSPADHEESTYCKTSLTVSNDSKETRETCFKISRSFEEIPVAEKTVCWLPLFSNATVAWGFLTPARLGGVGLEISVPLMASLTGARHAVEYQNGIVLKGLSTMLVPTNCTRIGPRRCVQWHFIFQKNESRRLSYQYGIAQCQNRVFLEQLDLSSLTSIRAFVGWCSSVEMKLGHVNVDYENIRYSGAQEVGNGLRVRGGSLGFQQFALAQVDFTLGAKDGRCHFQRRGPYDRLVEIAERTYILLLDTGTRRAWLVPASGVLMHVAQHRNKLNPYISGGTRVIFEDRPSFKEQLLFNCSTNLSDETQYHFKDMITSVWSILEFLLDQTVKSETNSGLDILSPFERAIEGYEFKDVVQERSPLRRKKWKLREGAGRWPALIKDINTLVLFASGLGDLIKPSATQVGLCRMWKTVPNNKDYLVTTIKIVLDLYEVAGCEETRQYITTRSQLRWHQGEGALLFEDCLHPDFHSCLCNRVQRLVTRGFMGKIEVPGHLEENGAIIFGKQRASPYLKYRGSPNDSCAEIKKTSTTARLQGRLQQIFGIEVNKQIDLGPPVSFSSSLAKGTFCQTVDDHTRGSSQTTPLTEPQTGLGNENRAFVLERKERVDPTHMSTSDHPDIIASGSNYHPASALTGNGNGHG